MNKTCNKCKIEFEITEIDQQFYKKMDVPEPCFCPDCRSQRRLIWLNSRHLYKRACDKCGKDTIGTYSSEKKLKVYCKTCYWSDDWDETTYGKDFDFTRPFFEQFKELVDVVPHLAVNNEDDVNSDYTNMGYKNSNCYMCFGSDLCDQCFYCTNALNSRNTYDSFYCNNLELCSFCVDCFKCYNTHYSQQSENLRDCYLCFDCKNCNNCFGSAGLRNKKYYFFNEKLNEEQWHKQIREYLEKNNIKQLYELAQSVWLKVPRRANVIINSENCQGNYLRNCSNCEACFDCEELVDSKYCIHVIPKSKDLMDVYGSGATGELSYEFVTGYGYNMRFCILCYNQASNLDYCMLGRGSSDCFGCFSVRKKKYCILNKQYSKEEYFELKEKIIQHMKKTGEWGEFFDINLSPFGYNETEAFTFFPLTKEAAIAQGFKWYEESNQVEIKEDIKNNVYQCTSCSKDFKLIQQELDFYKKQTLPLPTECFQCRFIFLQNLRLPYKIWERQCQSCNNGIITSYSPESPAIVYCPDCYRKKVY